MSPPGPAQAALHRHPAKQSSSRDFGIGLARAFAGAVIFGLPLLMTMEMWWLGSYMPAWRLALLLALFFPFLVMLSWHAGFEPTFSWRDDVLDALVAYAVGFSSSAGVLWMIGALEPAMGVDEWVGRTTLQAIPASIGALLAQTQLGERAADEASEARGGIVRYASELFIMAVGALFLAFNLAPTEEMLLIGTRMSDPKAILLVLVSIAVMHAFVYAVAFRGQPRHEGGALRLMLLFTLPGYALAALISAYMLWSFGTLDGLSGAAAMHAIAVLGFPAAIGAAAARLIL